MSERAIIYARVSTDIQRENYSIPSQVKAAITYAKDHGYSIVGDQYVDLQTGKDCLSGKGAVPAYVDQYTSLELSRPSLDAAINYLEQHGFDVLMVYALDRLARDPYIRQTLEREIEARGARVEYVSGNYDNTPEGEVRKDLEATFAKWENAKRIERCLRGKREKARRGLFVNNRPPFGYVVDADIPGGLMVVEEQATVVRRVFDLYVNHGESIRGIAEILKQEKIPNWSGKTNWAKSSVGRMLANETYAGVCYYDKWERVRQVDGERLKKKPKDQWIQINVEPIIDADTFERAQARRNRNQRRLRRQPSRTYMLSGMIICADCGRPYLPEYRKPNKERRRVNPGIAYRHRLSQGHCRNHWVSAAKLEPEIWQQIEQFLCDPATLLEAYQAGIDHKTKQQERIRGKLEVLKRAEINQQQKQDNLLSSYIDPDIGISKAEFINKRDRIDKELGRIRSEITELEQHFEQAPSKAGLVGFETFAYRMRERIQRGDKISVETKRKVLQKLQVEVLIDENADWELSGWILPENNGLLDTTSCSAARPAPARPSFPSPCPASCPA